MSGIAASVAPHHTCDLYSHIGRKTAHAFTIASVFQPLPQTHAQVARTSASLAKACRYLANADCCSLRLCSSASSSLFCLASSICLMSLHSQLGASSINKVLLFSILQCNAVSQKHHTQYMTTVTQSCQLVRVHKVQRCHCVCATQTQTQWYCPPCQQVFFMP